MVDIYGAAPQQADESRESFSDWTNGRRAEIAEAEMAIPIGSPVT
jgi:hypothetical protein